MATWPTTIDDDSTGTGGTVVNDALFDAVKLYIDDLTPTAAQDIPYNVSNFNATSGTFHVEAGDLVLNRWARLGPKHVVWAFYINNCSILNATASQLILQNLPFTARTNQVSRLGWSTVNFGLFDAFLQTQGNATINLLPVGILQGTSWAVNTNATILAWSGVLETL